MTTDRTIDSPAAPEPKRRWLEPASAVLMAVATLSTAWCSYQNSRWSGRSSDLGTRADKLERQAVAQYIEAQQIESMQLKSVMESVDAHLKGDEKLERFYVDRFAAELKPAYEKWMALKPFDNPTAPPHPFTPELYTPRFQKDIRDANTEAARDQAASNAAGVAASTYLSNTVLLASVLFFAGTAGRFDQRYVRQGSFAFALALFLYAAVRMTMLPVA